MVRSSMKENVQSDVKENVQSDVKGNVKGYLKRQFLGKESSYQQTEANKRLL